MDKVSVKLTVFFEEPFWRGVFERISEGELAVCKVTFGAEPKDYEVYDLMLEKLLSFTIQSGCGRCCKRRCAKSETDSAGSA